MQPLHTRPGAAGALTSTPSSHRRRPDLGSRLTPGSVTAGRAPRCGGRIINRLLLRCFRPVFPSVTHRAAGSGRPQCHGTRSGLYRCAASGPSSLPSLTGPRGRTAHNVTASRAVHKCCDCWCSASGPLSPCPPSSPAGVDVKPTRMRTS